LTIIVDYSKADPGNERHILTVVQTQSLWSRFQPLKLKPGVFCQCSNHRRATLIAMGHPQPSTGTPLVTDNSTSKRNFKKISSTEECVRLGYAIPLVEDRIKQDRSTSFGKQEN
jgi:hypothetical protein